MSMCVFRQDKHLFLKTEAGNYETDFRIMHKILCKKPTSKLLSSILDKVTHADVCLTKV